jgi:hypothetical protein
MDPVDRTAYFIDQGRKRPITATANGNLWGNNNWRPGDAVDIDNIDDGPPLDDDAHLARGPIEPVYLISGSSREAITARGFAACGFKPTTQTVSQDELNAMSDGGQIDYNPPPFVQRVPQYSGARFMDSQDRTVYYIDKGLRRPITAAANNNLWRNNSWQSGTRINISSITKGALLDDDTYLARDSGGTVYLRENNEGQWLKHPIKGSDASGFNTSLARPISDADLSAAIQVAEIDYHPRSPDGGGRVGGEGGGINCGSSGSFTKTVMSDGGDLGGIVTATNVTTGASPASQSFNARATTSTIAIYVVRACITAGGKCQVEGPTASSWRQCMSPQVSITIVGSWDQ